MARAKKQVEAGEPSAAAVPAAAPPAPAPAPAPPAPAPETPPAETEAASTDAAAEAPGAPGRNRTQNKVLKDLDNIRNALLASFEDNDKVKAELKETKSATRRPRSVRVGKKRPASEVEVAA